MAPATAYVHITCLQPPSSFPLFPPRRHSVIGSTRKLCLIFACTLKYPPALALRHRYTPHAHPVKGLTAVSRGQACREHPSAAAPPPLPPPPPPPDRFPAVHQGRHPLHLPRPSSHPLIPVAIRSFHLRSLHLALRHIHPQLYRLLPHRFPFHPSPPPHHDARPARPRVHHDQPPAQRAHASRGGGARGACARLVVPGGA